MPSRDLEATVASPSSQLAKTIEYRAQINWVFPDPDLPPLQLLDCSTTIGRSDCTCVLDGHEVSRMHARIDRTSEQYATYEVKDCASKNGVHVNGKRVPSARLTHRDVLRIGEWVGLFTIETSEPPNRVAEVGAPPFRYEHGMLVGPSLVPAVELAQRAAEAGLSIVIQGETGTGKELLARAIHTWARRGGDYVPVNCAAIPEGMAEAELFGYCKGAFTGALKNHPGYMRSADRGTLLLDELPQLPLTLQRKLLRAIEQREVKGMGESRPVPVDVLIVSASQYPLEELVAAGRFARDLQMRIQQVVVRLAPLRERNADLGYLIRELIRRHMGGRQIRIDPKVAEALCLYDWPGNLRELSSELHALCSLHGHEPRLKHIHLPAHLRLPSANSVPPKLPATSDSLSVDKKAPEVLRPQLLDALKQSRGNLTRAAKILGVPRQWFYMYLSKQELSSFREVSGIEDAAPSVGDDLE